MTCEVVNGCLEIKFPFPLTTVTLSESETCSQNIKQNNRRQVAVKHSKWTAEKLTDELLYDSFNNRILCSKFVSSRNLRNLMSIKTKRYI